MPNFSRDLTEGSVFKRLLSFSVPFLFANLLQALYSVIDMIVVGQFVGPTGVSAVQMGSQVMLLVNNMVAGLGVGATVLVAQFQGAGRRKDQRETIGTLFSLFIILSIIVTVVMVLLNDPILRALGADETVFADASKYMLICSAGSVFSFGYNAISGILRGMGDSTRPLIFVAIAELCNIVLDILFVGTFGLKAAGAALATVIAMAISCVISVIYLKRNNFIFDFSPRSFKMKKDKLALIFKIGIPSTVQFSITGFSFLLLTGLSNHIAPVVGSTVLGIGSKLNTFGILACIAMSSSISSMSAQNIGAGRYERAEKTMWCGMLMAFAVSAAVFTTISIFPDAVMGLFMNGDGLSGNELELYNRCMEIGPMYLRLISFDYLFACVFFCTNGLATGSGHTMFSLLNAAVNSLLIRVPAAYILSSEWGFSLGLKGVAIALGFSPIISAVIGVLYIRSGRWKKPVVRMNAPDLNKCDGKV